MLIEKKIGVMSFPVGAELDWLDLLAVGNINQLAESTEETREFLDPDCILYKIIQEQHVDRCVWLISLFRETNSIWIHN